MVRTIDNVKDRLCVIRSHAANRDNEAAHSEEDKLYQELLIAIAEGKARPESHGPGRNVERPSSSGMRLERTRK